MNTLVSFCTKCENYSSYVNDAQECEDCGAPAVNITAVSIAAVIANQLSAIANILDRIQRNGL